jgi:hypothetical protein
MASTAVTADPLSRRSPTADRQATARRNELRPTRRSRRPAPRLNPARHCRLHRNGFKLSRVHFSIHRPFGGDRCAGLERFGAIARATALCRHGAEGDPGRRGALRRPSVPRAAGHPLCRVGQRDRHRVRLPLSRSAWPGPTLGSQRPGTVSGMAHQDRQLDRPDHQAVARHQPGSRCTSILAPVPSEMNGLGSLALGALTPHQPQTFGLPSTVLQLRTACCAEAIFSTSHTHPS